MPAAHIAAPPQRAHTKKSLSAELGLTWRTIAARCAANDVAVPRAERILGAYTVEAIRALFVA